MYANPTLYDRSNFLQVRDGAQMIARIKSDFAEKAIDTVLDIGCGTGNLTELINRKLKPKRTIAFDLAPSMIDFARNRRRPSLVGGEEEEEVHQEGVKYYEGSACEAFDKLAKKLNLKPSSVDVITSFYCIHWVPDKGQACTNIFRFLKPGGRFYMIISVWNELFPVQHRIIHHPYWRPYLIECLRKRLGLGDDEELDESMVANFQVESKPKNDDLQRFWKNHCTIAGLEMNEMTFFYADYPFKSLVDFNKQVECVCYWLNYVPAEQHRQFLDDYFSLIEMDYVNLQTRVQKVRRRSLNVLPVLPVMNFGTADKDGGNGNQTKERRLSTMTVEQEAVTKFRFDYIYATIVGQKP